MKLTVKNFGPIHEAKNIDVSPMTIFVGPSNTGKSYLAVLIYSIVKTLRHTGGYAPGSRYAFNKPDESINVTETMSYHNQEQILLKVNKLFVSWAREISLLWKEEIALCLGEEGERMIRSENNISVEVSGTQNTLILCLPSPDESKLNLSPQQGNDFYDLIVQKVEFYTNFLIESYDEEEIDATGGLSTPIAKMFVETTYSLFASLLFSDQIGTENRIQAHYLPAIRGGIMQSHRAIVGSLIQQASRGRSRDTASLPLFSGILSDFMQKIIDVEVTRERTPDGDPVMENSSDMARKGIVKIGENMEKSILEGKINVRMSDASYPDLRYQFKRNGRLHDLPLMSTSAMVAELAPVSLFIRNHVNHGDLFIIEEPEAHLHPEAQRDISGTLAWLVDAGVYVLATTHSDYILEQISNYVHAQEIESKNGMQKLSKEKISVYFFNRLKKSKHQNTVVKNVEYDPDMGFLTEDHVKVSTALYNETVGLFQERENNGN